jgi:hypothetical protein
MELQHRALPPPKLSGIVDRAVELLRTRRQAAVASARTQAKPFRTTAIPSAPAGRRRIFADPR